MGNRIRLDDDERIYLIDLVNENTKLQGALVSLSIRKLLRKLGDDSIQISKARKVPNKSFKCHQNGCTKVVRSASGLNRHTTAAHHRAPTESEKIDITKEQS
jgi:hypothetical protein